MLATDSILRVINLVSMETFGDWITQELKKRGWSQADLARAAEMDSAVISNLINNRRGAGHESVYAIAKAFKYPPEKVMREAGFLPKIPEMTAKREELLFLYDQLPEKEKDNLIKYIRVNITLLEQSGEINPNKK